MNIEQLFAEVQNNTNSTINEQRIMAAVDAYTEALIAANAIVSGSLPLVSREELISSLEDKRICKMSNLPADIYYLSRKETSDYLMDNYLITKRQ